MFYEMKISSELIASEWIFPRSLWGAYYRSYQGHLLQFIENREFTQTLLQKFEKDEGLVPKQNPLRKKIQAT